MRVPPHDLDAEMSVLGAMLESQDALLTVIELLRPEDFYKPRHREVFQAAVGLHQRGEPCDVITLANELASLDRLEDIGGKPYLAALIGAYPSSASIKKYAGIVQQMSQLRNLIAACAEITEMAFEQPTDVGELLERAEAVIGSVAHGQLRDLRHLPRSLYEELPGILEALESDAESDEAIGFTSGIESLDDVLGGFQRGRYVVVGANTSFGKTSLLTQLVTMAARQGRKVLHVSLEQPRDEVIHRILAQESGVYVQHLTNPQLMTEEDWARLSKTSGDLPGDDILITDGTVDEASLLSRVRRAVSKVGRIDVLAIDYIQLIKGTGRFNNRADEVSAVSRMLKGLANEMGICVLAAAQLNREFAKNKRRPILSDLRESGSLEHDPDLVILMHRPEGKELDVDLKHMKLTELIVRKNRHGPTGIVETHFDAPINRFVEI